MELQRFRVRFCRSWALILLVVITACGSTFYPLLPAFENVHGIAAISGDQQSRGKKNPRDDLGKRLENSYQTGLKPTTGMLISERKILVTLMLNIEMLITILPGLGMPR